MMNFVVNNCLSIVQNRYHYDDIKKAEIKYGLQGIYLTLTKLIVMTIMAILFNIFKEYIWFTLIYIPLRTFSFGWHANKNIQCWVFSIISFLILPYVASLISFNLFTINFIFICSFINFALFAPADTKKRPLVNKKRNTIFKYISLSIIILYYLISLIYPNFVNLIIMALTLQSILINPVVYFLSKQEFNNYKNYNC